MNQVDNAWRVWQDLYRQYPLWPSTFSTCNCGRGWARGGGKCADCYEEELAQLVGAEAANRARKAMQEVGLAWDAVREAAGKDAA